MPGATSAPAHAIVKPTTLSSAVAQHSTVKHSTIVQFLHNRYSLKFNFLVRRSTRAICVSAAQKTPRKHYEVHVNTTTTTHKQKSSARLACPCTNPHNHHAGNKIHVQSINISTHVLHQPLPRAQPNCASTYQLHSNKPSSRAPHLPSTSSTSRKLTRS